MTTGQILIIAAAAAAFIVINIIMWTLIAKKEQKIRRNTTPPPDIDEKIYGTASEAGFRLLENIVIVHTNDRISGG